MRFFRPPLIAGRWAWISLILLAAAPVARSDDGVVSPASVVAAEADPARAGGLPPETLLAPVALERVAERGAAPPGGGLTRQPFPLDWKVIGTVAAVGLAALLLRRAAPRVVNPLPPDVFAVLGEASLGGQHPVRVVRFGPKTLLVSLTPTGCHTLAELADPQATACIAAACRAVQGRSGSSPSPAPAGSIRGGS